MAIELSKFKMERLLTLTIFFLLFGTSYCQNAIHPIEYTSFKVINNKVSAKFNKQYNISISDFKLDYSRLLGLPSGINIVEQNVIRFGDLNYYQYQQLFKGVEIEGAH